METLANLESFVRSAEGKSFSAAARRMSLTPAAVSRNVGVLERNLGVRLFQRSTRKLTLTEAGERLLAGIGGNLDALQDAIAQVASDGAEPAGVLKVSLAPTFGTRHVLPLLPELRARYPLLTPEWHFENRQVDLIGEGYDAAIGGGLDLAPGVVSKTLAPAHLVAVASPAYMSNRPKPVHPNDLAGLDGIVMRSLRTGKLLHYVLRDSGGKEQPASLSARVVLNDPAALRDAAVLGLGVALLAVPDVLAELEEGSLVRLLPRHYADAGTISIYYASRTYLPAKTRAFVDFVANTFEKRRLARRFSANVR